MFVFTEKLAPMLFWKILIFRVTVENIFLGKYKNKTNGKRAFTTK